MSRDGIEKFHWGTAVLVRITSVSALNTIVGVSAFPILKTIFRETSNVTLMVVAYVFCVLFSFFSHGKISFHARLSAKKLLMFTLTNLMSLGLMILIVEYIVRSVGVDVRLVQPIVAVTLQIFVIMLYKLIFVGSDG